MYDSGYIGAMLEEMLYEYSQQIAQRVCDLDLLYQGCNRISGLSELPKEVYSIEVTEDSKEPKQKYFKTTEFQQEAHNSRNH
jgi:hypothetical protein